MKGLLFTYGLTYGGAVIALFNPFIGLLIYVCFAIIRPEYLWHYSVPHGPYSRIIAIALLLGWVFRGLGKWDLGRARPVVLALVAFWVWVLLSSTQAGLPEVAFQTVEETAKILLPFLVGITLIDSVRKLKALVWVIALSQGYVALELNQAYLGGFNYVQEIGFGGMDNNCVAIAMVAGFGFSFFLGLTETAWWRKLLGLAAAFLMGHCVLITFSRGGLLALIVTAGIAFVLLPKRPRHYLIFAAAVLLGVRLTGPEVLARFSTVFANGAERDYSAQSRLDMWRDCMDVMVKHPVFGVGPRHWPLIAPQYGWPLGKEAHSLWVQLGAETGVVGLLLLLAFYGTCVRRLWPLVGRNSPEADPWLKSAARMVIASVCGFLVASQFVSLVGLELPYYVTLVGAGALRLASTQAVPDEASFAARAEAAPNTLLPSAPCP